MMFFETLESRQLLAGEPTILFVRGATRSGGFLEGSNAATRNEQLADIYNLSEVSGNAGWGSLAQTLRDAGLSVEQINEAKEPDAPASGFVNGRPVRLESLDLSRYAAIVFGSNNARYAKASIDAIENYIRGGGGALFISDANFGSNWRDAADSDQQFLARFGLIVNQDAAAGTTTLSRAGGEFVASDDPILAGVDSITAEGVSPLVVPDASPPGVTIRRIFAATGQTRNNDGTSADNAFQGSMRGVNDRDAALVTATAGSGRVAAFFDRNTFFNANGVGTDITEGDNLAFARNLFRWIVDSTPPRVVSQTLAQGSPRQLRIEFDDRITGLTRSDILLRDPFDATPVPRDRWGWALEEVDGRSVLWIRIKGAQPAGLYQFQINAHRISDDAGNTNAARIRYNFTLAAGG